jgi:hypothetical protein
METGRHIQADLVDCSLAPARIRYPDQEAFSYQPGIPAEALIAPRRIRGRRSAAYPAMKQPQIRRRVAVVAYAISGAPDGIERLTPRFEVCIKLLILLRSVRSDARQCYCHLGLEQVACRSPRGGNPDIAAENVPCWPCKNRNRPVEPVGGLQKNRNFRFWWCFGSINRQKIG